jgi:hypothetical protein
LVTAPMVAGNILTAASFEGGGTFTDKFANGVVFTGTFNNAAFDPKAGTPNTWLFIGLVVGGTLTVPGYAPQLTGNVDIFFTTVSAVPICAAGGGCTFRNSQGTTSFENIPLLSPVPEPGTLVLLGSGLAVVLSRRAIASRFI